MTERVAAAGSWPPPTGSLLHCTLAQPASRRRGQLEAESARDQASGESRLFGGKSGPGAHDLARPLDPAVVLLCRGAGVAALCLHSAHSSVKTRTGFHNRCNRQQRDNSPYRNKRNAFRNRGECWMLGLINRRRLF